MNSHLNFMRRALSLAKRGRYTAHPNPMVGCVIVKNNKIIAEGWHSSPGAAHAEYLAIQQAGLQARGAELYVNLEPCSHHGKTPPCVQTLINAQVKRVFIPFLDPNPLINGRGVAQLQKAGIEVNIGLGSEEASYINRFFLKTMITKRVYVIAKWAMTLDGQLTLNSQQRWITNETSREHAHQQRAQVSAIAIGANTLRCDQPLLTARPQKCIKSQIRSPLRLVISRDPNLDINYLLEQSSQTSNKNNTWLVTPSIANYHDHHLSLPSKNNPNQVDLENLLLWLAKQNCHSLLVEGGSDLLNHFFEADLVDEMHIYQAIRHSQWHTKPALPFLNKLNGNWQTAETKILDGDVFIRARKSNV